MYDWNLVSGFIYKVNTGCLFSYKQVYACTWRLYMCSLITANSASGHKRWNSGYLSGKERKTDRQSWGLEQGNSFQERIKVLLKTEEVTLWAGVLKQHWGWPDVFKVPLYSINEIKEGYRCSKKHGGGFAKADTKFRLGKRFWSSYLIYRKLLPSHSRPPIQGDIENG